MRLASDLSGHRRLLLVRALLDHVIGALRKTPGIDRIALVSPERDSVAEDVVLLTRERQGLNEDLAYALSEVVHRGATHVVIIPADLPLLVPDDVTALLASMRSIGVALAPDSLDRGTNALAFATASPVRLSFGEDSFAKHLTASRSQGIEPGVLRRPGLCLDVDDMEDLRSLQALPSWAAHCPESN